jgi:hypothetical protein
VATMSDEEASNATWCNDDNEVGLRNLAARSEPGRGGGSRAARAELEAQRRGRRASDVFFEARAME